MKKHLLKTEKDLRNNKRLTLKKISKIIGYSGLHIKQLFKLTLKEFSEIVRFSGKEFSEIVRYSGEHIKQLFRKDP